MWQAWSATGRWLRLSPTVGWGIFRQMLEYKAARAGRHLIVIDRWYPSSKTCSACGHLLASTGPRGAPLDVPRLRHPA